MKGGRQATLLPRVAEQRLRRSASPAACCEHRDAEQSQPPNATETTGRRRTAAAAALVPDRSATAAARAVVAARAVRVGSRADVGRLVAALSAVAVSVRPRARIAGGVTAGAGCARLGTVAERPVVADVAGARTALAIHCGAGRHAACLAVGHDAEAADRIAAHRVDAQATHALRALSTGLAVGLWPCPDFLDRKDEAGWHADTSPATVLRPVLRPGLRSNL